MGVRDACNCMNVKYYVHSLSAITCVANADQFFGQLRTVLSTLTKCSRQAYVIVTALDGGCN